MNIDIYSKEEIEKSLKEDKLAEGRLIISFYGRHEEPVDFEDYAGKVIHVCCEDIEADERRLSTGFKKLDDITGGLNTSRFILIAAESGMGKTTFAKQILKHVTEKLKKPAVFFSTEIPKEQLEKQRFFAASANEKLFIDDSSITLDEFYLKCRHYKEINDIQMIIVDCLQLMRGKSKKNYESRQQEMSYISGDLKNLAWELNVHVIGIYQMHDMGQNHRPVLSDLRADGAGALVQDADVVIFMYRDEHYNSINRNAGITEVIIDKNRNGPVGIVKFKWDSERKMWSDLEYYDKHIDI